MKHLFYRNLFNRSIHEGHSIAICRPPQNSFIHSFVSFQTPELNQVSPSNTPFFVISPFHHADQGYVLRANRYYLNEELLHTNDVIESKASFPQSEKVYYTSNRTPQAISKIEFLQYVQHAVDEISKGSIKKLVPARCTEKSLRNPFSIIDFFFLLNKKFPDAFIYVFSSPTLGTWVGATPELLLSSSGNKMSTVALAGTLHSESTDGWTTKEQKEHALVEEFISKVLDQVHIGKVTKSPVQSIKAGNLFHLFSLFEIISSFQDSGKKFSGLLSALNPTPAVCGLPADKAYNYILSHEKLDRGLYTGFAGMNTSGNISLYVNLRCLELFKNMAVLYAGAGITSESDPEKEWIETEKKLQTLGDLL